MPIPQFHGKKGEKPEDHIMKVEDYFQNYKVGGGEWKCGNSKFITLLFFILNFVEVSTLTVYAKIFDPDKAPDDETKLKTMKNLIFCKMAIERQHPQLHFHRMA